MIYLKNITGETQELYFPRMEEVLSVSVEDENNNEEDNNVEDE